MYELFDHTADIGLRVRSADREDLFREAATGLFSLIAEPVRGGPSSCPVEIEVRGERLDLLLFDWLSEWLYLSDRDRTILCDFEVEWVEGGLRGRATAVPMEEAGALLREVKAITYHGLRVEHAGTEWIAEVIVDV